MVFLWTFCLFIIHIKLQQKKSVTFLPSLLFILMYPSLGLDYLITYILVLTIIYFIKNVFKPYMNGYKSLFLVYSLLLLSIFLENDPTLKLSIGIPSMFCLLLFFGLYKKEHISIWIIPSLIISFFLFRSCSNPFLMGSILGILNIGSITNNKHYETNMGIHLLLFFILDLIIPHSIYLDGSTMGILLNKISLYTLVGSILLYYIRKRF